jgi:iron complex outermembrane receptor protein
VESKLTFGTFASVVALSVILGSPATSTAQIRQAGTITGVVRSRVSGQPVPSARITIVGDSRQTVTGPSGRFRIENVPAGPVEIVVRAPGFLELHPSAAQVPAASILELTVELEPTLNILERVQVTATKEPLELGDVPAQTTVIDRDLIDSRGDQTLTQAIAHVPGAVVSTQLGIFESVMLRGMPRGDPEFTNTLLLIDGVPQTLSNNGARIVAMPIYDATSIEIVRGPNSALYGRTAIGGTVNIRTADPTPRREVGLDLTAGEFGLAKGVGRVSGPLKSWGGYYLSAGAERNAGYFVNRTTSEFSDSTTSMLGKLTFAPNRTTFGSVSLNHVNSKNFTPTNEPIVDGELLHVIDPRFDRRTNFNIPGPNYKQRETRVALNLTRQLAPWASAVEVFGYRDVQHEFVEDGDFIAGPFDLAANTVSMYPFSQTMNEHIFYQELRLELKGQAGAARNQALTVGGSYERNNGTLASDFIYNDPDLFGFTINYLNPVIPPRSEWQHETGSRLYHLNIAGLFAQYRIDPTTRLNVTAGGRYDRLALDNTRDEGARLDQTFSAFSPKVSAIFKLLRPASAQRATLNLYGAYSQSFLPPRRPSSLVPADVPLHLQPEDIENYEAGIKAGLAGGRLSLEAAVFRMREDGVVLSTRQGPFFLPTNAGKIRYRGVETGVTMSLSRAASLYMNAAFYHHRFGEFVIESEDGDESLKGNRLPISPDYVVNWGAAFNPIPSIALNLDVKHLGAVQANRENSFLIDAYALVDAAASWQRGRVRITLSAHNLLNKQYYWNSDGETADPGRPRQVILSTSIRFQ